MMFGISLDIEIVDFASSVEIVYGDSPAESRPHLLPSFSAPDRDDA